MFDYHARPGLLRDRVLVITGAGDGIGRAAALAYARHGATVVLVGRTRRKLEDTYDAITAANGPEPAIYPLNLDGAAPKDYADLARVVEAEFGAVHGLLNNAGVLGPRTPLAQFNPSEWDRVLRINLTSQFLLTQALLPVLAAAPRASVVFTSSGVGRVGRAYWGAYSVSKFGVEALTQIWADELENISSIRINAINPGATRTEMRAAAYPGESPDENPAPDDIMPLYLYLMGDDSVDCNGRSLDAQRGAPGDT